MVFFPTHTCLKTHTKTQARTTEGTSIDKNAHVCTHARKMYCTWHRFTHRSTYSRTHTCLSQQHSWVLRKRAINLSVSYEESEQLPVLWKKGARRIHTHCSDSPDIHNQQPTLSAWSLIFCVGSLSGCRMYVLVPGCIFACVCVRVCTP